MNDPIAFALKDEDSAPAPVSVETIQPRRVRTQLATHDAALLTLQDDAESLLPHVTSSEGRKIWRRLFNGLGAGHKAVQAISDAVERGG